MKNQNYEAPDSVSALAITSKVYKYKLLTNILGLKPPCPGTTFLTRGDFQYFHYGCDGFNDQGWGCAYRTLQSMCTWILYKQDKVGTLHVPGLREIQETLVRIEDKPKDFIGSRAWIGALEVFYVVNDLYDVSCKILHIPSRDEFKNHMCALKDYFENIGGFVMMGGDMDAASKGIAGIHIAKEDVYLLVIDPHFVGIPISIKELVDCGYISWKKTTEFVDSSFYNLCLPQLK
ncbi:probable Ufm1-specific protease 1 [Teleopsis dalmanni]|uniref:probable Ufm1-specific protease 1 n=1 Tax=Teleopsis dalmanni TaxID=139649 RepID=UPI0018CF769B|nr:probable Ufm1-specific protease 1 [Teleopsis dalmanni]